MSRLQEQYRNEIAASPMSENDDADSTLPSVVASLSGLHRDQVLTLTIIFHPHTARIGQAVTLPTKPGRTPWVLGRRTPAFEGAELAASALEDRHVSRRALELVSQGGALILRRCADSSRCQVAGRELEGSVELTPQQLREGVPLLLGNAIVLLLRLGPPAEECNAAATGEDLLLGSSVYMDKLRRQLAAAAGCDLDVLIQGETGTGKELVAKAIHRASRRSAAALVCVNMAAIPVELAPAALFGSARGAFTGADKAAAGYFRQAQGGTLFLDEIGDTSAEIQPQLLRALQEREIQAVGGPVQSVDVRVISATDAPLDGESCSFKVALRHRLGACEISLLPLRQHPEDLGRLLLHFVAAAATEMDRVDLLPCEHSEAIEIAAWAGLFYRFLCYRWPGNVRQLDNFARQVMLASDRRVTVPDSIMEALNQGIGGGSCPGPLKTSRRRMEEVSREEFENALRAGNYAPARAAERLSVSRTAVYRRIKDTPGYRLAADIPPDEVRSILVQYQGDCAAAALHLQVSPVSLRARARNLDVDWY
jgi:DNA-binding NtrC family response regulator